MKTVIITLLITIIPVGHLFAKSYNSHWGIGIITIPDVNRVADAIYLPKKLNIYDAGGTVIGEIRKQGDYEVSVVIKAKKYDYSGNNRLSLDFKEIGYEGLVLKYYEKRGDLLRVLVNTTGTGCYIKEPDLKGRSFIAMDWMKFMLQKNMTYLAPETGLNLRSGTGVDKKKIRTLRGDTFEIKLTGKTSGLWAQAEVEEYDSDMCSGEHNLLKKYKGWIKLLDDRGYPNIWYPVRGC